MEWLKWEKENGMRAWERCYAMWESGKELEKVGSVGNVRKFEIGKYQGKKIGNAKISGKLEGWEV